MPQSIFKKFWNFIIILLLLYTATYMPYKTAFMEEENSGFLFALELIVDFLFVVDIGVNLISAIELEGGGVEN